MTSVIWIKNGKDSHMKLRKYKIMKKKSLFYLYYKVSAFTVASRCAATAECVHPFVLLLEVAQTCGIHQK